MTRRRQGLEARLGVLAARLDNLSPLAVLARGYAVCWNADRTAIVRSALQVTPGEHLRVTLNEGELLCEAKESLILDR
jgi:exodeoxyribonuclease VII large subunit